MRSTAICYSPADSGTATELRAYLETNCPVAIEDGVVQMGSDLLDAVETGLSFDYVLVLLSQDSTLAAWPRDRWQPILVEQAKQLRTRILYVLLNECKFPEVLRREQFFDLSHDYEGGRRSLKRWMLTEMLPVPPKPKLPERAASSAPNDVEEFERLAEWPEFVQTGDYSSALEFAYARHADFEAVVWVNCARRGRVGVLGDSASGLGLRLEGTWEENAEALRLYCVEHRVLLAFECLDPAAREVISFGGRASVIVVEDVPLPPRQPLADLIKLFSSWKRNGSKCLAALGDVESHLDSPEVLRDENWPDACAVCSAAVALLKDYGRFAEAYDMLARISGATQIRGDLAAQGRVEWETSWILEQWNQPVQIPGRIAAAISEPTQLSLFG